MPGGSAVESSAEARADFGTASDQASCRNHQHPNLTGDAVR